MCNGLVECWNSYELLRSDCYWVSLYQVDSTLAATVYIPTSSISSSPYATESAQKDVVNIICVDPLKDEEDVATSKFCFVLRVSPVPLDTGADTTKK